MEKYVFIKKEERLFPIRISERLYEEIRQLPVIPEEKLADDKAGWDGGTLDAVLPEPLLEIEVQSKTTSVFVKDKDYFRKIEFKDIRWIEASGSYSCLNLECAPKLMLSFNLRELSAHLPSRLFVRVHRSYIVNIDFVDSFIGNTLCIGKNQIPVSKQHKRYVVGRLNILGNVKW